MAKPKMISVIIPTKNEAANIGRCLKSIFGNGYNRVEVIVVDQQSTDNTVGLAKRMGAKVVSVPQTAGYLPPSASRNIGFERSSGQYIYHLDADMELEKGLLEEVAEIFKDQKVVGLVVPETDVPLNFWARGKAMERSFYKNTPMEAARISRRQVFAKTQYSSEISAGEDWYIHSLIKKFGQMSRTTKTVYHYLGSMTLGRELNKKMQYGKGSRNFIARNSNEIINLFLTLIPVYIKGVVMNLFKDPIGVTAFLIIRLVDVYSLILGVMWTRR